MVTNEEAVAILMTFGKSEAKARKILSSRSGVAYREQIENFAAKIRLLANDPDVDIISYIQNHDLSTKRR